MVALANGSGFVASAVVLFVEKSLDNIEVVVFGGGDGVFSEATAEERTERTPLEQGGACATTEHGNLNPSTFAFQIHVQPLFWLVTDSRLATSRSATD